MSREDLWNRAADAMREDEDPRWHAVSDWLRAEAGTLGAMEPFIDLVNMAMEQESGIKSYLRLGRKPDGDVTFLADTNEGATAVALAYLMTPPTSLASSNPPEARGHHVTRQTGSPAG